MSRLIIWSDLHLGHRGISKAHRPEFSSDEEHDNVLYDTLAGFVRKRDVLYLLGDIAMTDHWLGRLADIPCESVRVVLGNHDTEFDNQQRVSEHAWRHHHFDRVYGLTRRGLAWMSHAPIHPNELRGRINIHGHVHRATVDDPRYVNACPEATGWKPLVHQLIISQKKSEGVI